MKLLRVSLCVTVSFMLSMAVSGCSQQSEAVDVKRDGGQNTAQKKASVASKKPLQLPVRYQNPGYVVPTEDGGDSKVKSGGEGDYVVKVGADINSVEPQPLWEVMRELVRLKGMSVSWANDVDRTVLVDVNIRAEEDYYKALENLLRQADYFYEIHGKTVLVKFKETKSFRIAVPFMKGNYNSTVGGNFLSSRKSAEGTEGTSKISSDENSFDVWANIAENLDSMLEIWSEQDVMVLEDKNKDKKEGEEGGEEDKKDAEVEGEQEPPKPTFVKKKTSDSYYTIDKSVGVITVSAPRSTMKKVEDYINNLKNELYRQVMIEAKIIEVYLQDNSKIGLDWSQVLKDFPISGVVEMGLNPAKDVADMAGQVWPYVGGAQWVPDFDPTTGEIKDTGHYEVFGSDQALIGQGTFVSRIKMNNDFDFNVMLNALNEQGDASILSNPKIAVMNGQPALLSVGKDVSFISEFTTTVDDGTITYDVKTDSIVDGVSLGVMASIIDDDTVIMHLTPIATDIVDDRIDYATFGKDGDNKVGLPVVSVRQMSTMVKVRNGEMLIIGGLIDEVDSTTGNFAPVVGDIPVLRYLFGAEEKIKQKRELVILLTPKII